MTLSFTERLAASIIPILLLSAPATAFEDPPALVKDRVSVRQALIERLMQRGRRTSTLPYDPPAGISMPALPDERPPTWTAAYGSKLCHSPDSAVAVTIDPGGSV